MFGILQLEAIFATFIYKHTFSRIVMSRVRIERGKRKDLMSRLTDYLTISLAILAGFIILVSHNNPSITGYSVFSTAYGTASPYVLILLLAVIIFLYVRVNRE